MSIKLLSNNIPSIILGTALFSAVLIRTANCQSVDSNRHSIGLSYITSHYYDGTNTTWFILSNTVHGIKASFSWELRYSYQLSKRVNVFLNAGSFSKLYYDWGTELGDAMIRDYYLVSSGIGYSFYKRKKWDLGINAAMIYRGGGSETYYLDTSPAFSHATYTYTNKDWGAGLGINVSRQIGKRLDLNINFTHYEYFKLYDDHVFEVGPNSFQTTVRQLIMSYGVLYNF